VPVRVGVVAAVVVAALLSGVATWLGVRSQGIDVGLASLIGAGLNVVPSALVALGIGAVLLSVVPRAASATIYVVVVGSVMVDLVGALVTGFGWLRRLSLFHYMALAPAQSPKPTTLVVTTAVAIGLCLLAVVAFAWRDVRST